MRSPLTLALCALFCRCADSVRDTSDEGDELEIEHSRAGVKGGVYTVLTVTGFPNHVGTPGADRSFLNAQYTENTDVLISGLPTFWGGPDDHFFIYYCDTFGDWRIGTAHDWGSFENPETACACLAFAHSNKVQPVTNLQDLQFPGIQDGHVWHWIEAAQVTHVDTVGAMVPLPLGISPLIQEIADLDCSDPPVSQAHHQGEGTHSGGSHPVTATTPGTTQNQTNNAQSGANGGNTAGLPPLSINISVVMEPSANGASYHMAGQPQVSVQVLGGQDSASTDEQPEPEEEEEPLDETGGEGEPEDATDNVPMAPSNSSNETAVQGQSVGEAEEDNGTSIDNATIDELLKGRAFSSTASMSILCILFTCVARP